MVARTPSGDGSNRSGGEGALLEDEFVAHHFSGERRRRFMRQTRLTQRDDGRLQVDSASLFPDDADGAGEGSVRAQGWVSQEPAVHRTHVSGRTVEQLFLDACVDRDSETLAKLLSTWHATVTAAAETGRPPAAEGYYDEHTVAMVPSTTVDLMLSNYVMSGGTPVGIDDEWSVTGGADVDFVVWRALWWTAFELVNHGSLRPWPSSYTVNRLTAELCRVAGARVPDDGDLARWRRAEARMQAIIDGKSPAQELEQLDGIGRLTPSADTYPPVDPFTTLTTRMHELEAEITRLQRIEAEVVAQRSYTEHLEHDIAATNELAREKEQELELLRPQAAAAAAEIEAWRKRWAQWERRDPFMRFAPAAKRAADRLRGRRP